MLVISRPAPVNAVAIEVYTASYETVSQSVTEYRRSVRGRSVGGSPYACSVTLFEPGAGTSPPRAEAPGANAPLAVRMRPRSLDEVVGQQHLLGRGSPLRR
ncbi:MAG: Recombination protein MgsA, partial [Pseudonocardiales bacterium]|nr:Recombination protein MgsA [Pseudonocardiales bacterium]